MTTKLKNYFPMIRSREEILKEIDGNIKLTEKSARSRKKEKFTYKDVKGVYTIVLMDKSASIFDAFSRSMCIRFGRDLIRDWR